MRNTFALIATTALAALAVGCSDNDLSGDALRPHISPDLRYIVMLQTSAEDGLDADRSLRATWYPVMDPGRVRTVRIAPSGESADRVHMVFSPSSRKVAIAGADFLGVLDLVNDGPHAWQRVTPGSEPVTAVAWVTEQELRYVSHVSAGGVPARHARTVWQHDLAGRAGNRDTLYRHEPEITGGWRASDWPVEHFSPDGRYLVFASPWSQGEFHLLDAPAGKIIRSFGRADGQLASVAWKPDGSAVFCVGGSFSPSAVLVESDTGHITDYSVHFVEAFGELAPKLGPTWSADGKWLLVNDVIQRGCLVQLKPWRVKTLGLDLMVGDATPRSNAGFVAPLKVPGWVAVWQAAQSLYLSDYEGRRVVPLTDYDDWIRKGWAIGPDGRTVVMIHTVPNQPHHVVLAMPVDLSPAPSPDKSPTTRPDGGGEGRP